MLINLILLSLVSLSADLKWVEVDLSLWQDGRADFVYKVRWEVLDGTMSGFYFDESTVDPYFDRDNSYAIDEYGRKYPLEIKDLGARYDIILANGRRYGPGEITYIFHYGGDLGRSGNRQWHTEQIGEIGRGVEPKLLHRLGVVA